MVEPPPTRTVSVYLLRTQVETATDALSVAPERLESHTIKGLDGAVLYVSRSPARPPKWAEIFEGSAVPQLNLKRPTFGAVLLLKAGSRRYALTFGTGRHLLAYRSYERNFGLRVALNLVDPDRVRSANSRTFIDSALQVSRQISEPSDITGLEIDVQRDLLTRLEGSVARKELGKRVAGADAARLTRPLEVKQIRAVCSGLYKVSREITYKKRYEWIDWIQEITNPEEEETLSNEALKLLLEGKVDRFDVYPPEMVSDQVVEYGTKRSTTVMEPTRELLRATIESSKASNPETLAQFLQTRYIKALNEDGVEIKRWPWWDCLYYEHRGPGGTTILDRGVWLRVKRNEAKAIHDYVSAIPSSSLQLPEAERSEIEKHYNARAAASGNFRLLDRKLIKPIPSESPIEVCDLFSKGGEMVHVKRRKGGSSGLSHLFGQASVSSRMLVTAPAYAPSVRELLTDWADSLKDPPQPQDHPVVLAVILASEASGEGAAALPFFSKVFMRQIVQQIRAMRFPVFYNEIPAPMSS
jgi:uncharacterized protein (TIGR04141 family)